MPPLNSADRMPTAMGMRSAGRNVFRFFIFTGKLPEVFRLWYDVESSNMSKNPGALVCCLLIWEVG